METPHTQQARQIDRNLQEAYRTGNRAEALRLATLAMEHAIAHPTPQKEAPSLIQNPAAIPTGIDYEASILARDERLAHAYL